MALIGNYTVYDKLPLKYISAVNSSASVQSGNRGNFSQSGRVRSRMMQDQTTTALEYYALPNGAYPSLTWFIPQQAGQIGSSNQIYGLGSIVASLAGGRNATADLTGSGTVTNAFLSLIADLIASLTGAGDISPPPNLLALLSLSGNLTGAGAITAVLNAFASVQADLAGTGTLTLVPYATGELSADITGESTLSPQNLAAAVWSALASAYNVAGTMGEKLNDAGSAANPWTEVIDGTYTASDLLKLISASVAGELAGSPGGPILIKSVNGTTVRITATVDANGNRTGVTYNVS